jgi:hypothetical protein
MTKQNISQSLLISEFGLEQRTLNGWDIVFWKEEKILKYGNISYSLLIGMTILTLFALSSILL